MIGLEGSQHVTHVALLHDWFSILTNRLCGGGHPLVYPWEIRGCAMLHDASLSTHPRPDPSSLRPS